jgi:hypothetical protein
MRSDRTEDLGPSDLHRLRHAVEDRRRHDRPFHGISDNEARALEHPAVDYAGDAIELALVDDGTNCGAWVTYPSALERANPGDGALRSRFSTLPRHADSPGREGIWASMSRSDSSDSRSRPIVATASARPPLRYVMRAFRSASAPSISMASHVSAWPT